MKHTDQIGSKAYTALQKTNASFYDSSVDCGVTSFRFECEMVKPLVTHLPHIFHLYPGQRARLLREQSIGAVIPDLLLGIWSGELPRYDYLNTVSRHVLVWMAMQGVVENQQQLQEHLLISENAATSAVSNLQRVGALSKKDSGEVILRPEFDVSGSVRLIAIEMKLRRWREALSQAVEYARFANEAYVVLDGSQVEVDSEIENSFVSRGIGLFIQRNGELEQRIMAICASPAPSVERLFAVSKLTRSGPYCLA